MRRDLDHAQKMLRYALADLVWARARIERGDVHAAWLAMRAACSTLKVSVLEIAA